MDLPSLVTGAVAIVGVVVIAGGTGLGAVAVGVDALVLFSTSLADEPGRFDPTPPDGDGVGVEFD